MFALLIVLLVTVLRRAPINSMQTSDDNRKLFTTIFSLFADDRGSRDKEESSNAISMIILIMATRSH